MAVKKVNTKPEKNEEVTVDVETPVTENEEVVEDTTVETQETETPEVEITEVEVETPNSVEADIEVDTKSAEVNTNNKPNGNVKIRMRVDHKCCIAMERYDLKAGKTYVVPSNVKNILNKAGLLAPL